MPDEFKFIDHDTDRLASVGANTRQERRAGWHTRTCERPDEKGRFGGCIADRERRRRAIRRRRSRSGRITFGCKSRHRRKGRVGDKSGCREAAGDRRPRDRRRRCLHGSASARHGNAVARKRRRGRSELPPGQAGEPGAASCGRQIIGARRRTRQGPPATLQHAGDRRGQRERRRRARVGDSAREAVRGDNRCPGDRAAAAANARPRSVAMQDRARCCVGQRPQLTDRRRRIIRPADRRHQQQRKRQKKPRHNLSPPQSSRSARCRRR